MSNDLDEQIELLRKEFAGYQFGSPQRWPAKRAYEVPIKCECGWSSFFVADDDSVNGAFREKVRERYLLGCLHGKREHDDYKASGDCKTHGCVMWANNGWRCVQCTNKTNDLIAEGWPNVRLFPPSAAETTNAIGAGSWSVGVVFESATDMPVGTVFGEATTGASAPTYSNAGSVQREVTTSTFSDMLQSEAVRERMLDIIDKLNPAGRTPSKILTDALLRAETMLPHGIELTSERSAVLRAWHVIAACPHCGKREQISKFTERAIEEVATDSLAILLCARAGTFMQSCVAATCCDPMGRYVDGLRVRECLERYQTRQQGDGSPPWLTWKGTPIGPTAAHALTPNQLSAARSAWSAALRAKQQEAREKERAAIVCDDDRWEP